MKLLLAAVALAGASARLVSQLDTLPGFNDNGEVLVKFAIRSQEVAATVEPWMTAMEGVVANIFEVKNTASGEEVPYVGMHARFLVDNTTGLTMSANQQLDYEVDLSQDYAFPEPGEYSVRWRFDEAGSPALAVKIGTALGDRRAGWLANPTPLNCNAQQTTDIRNCDTAAKNQISRARAYLGGTQQPLFTTWFGTGSRTTVANCFGNCQTRANNGYRMQCNQAGCPSNTYAYVFPGDATFTVYLCSVFWSRPSERAETLVHELSHFNSVCRTDDWAYGRTACQNLARTNPARAINNADNICYFGADA